MDLPARIAPLLAQRAKFRAFIASRAGGDAEADDILQESLVKALQHAGHVRDDTKITAWFYQVIRRTLLDHAHSRAAAARRDDAWQTYTDLSADSEAQQAICGCFEALLDRLKPREAALIRAVELRGEPVAQAAAALGLSVNHASVALHRARRSLRALLEDYCGACAAGACLDCDCGERDTERIQ